MAELDERAVVQPDPGHVALLGGAHQGGGRGAEGAALGEADERFELRLVVERRRVVVGALGRQQVVDDAQAELAGGDPHALFEKAVDDVILAARQVVAPRLAVGDAGAGQALELDRHVLEDVAEPGALVLGHAAHEAAGRVVRAGVLGERRDEREEPVDEAGELPRRVLLELA